MRRLALLVVPVLVAACMSTVDSSIPLDPTDANVTGAFALSSINGTALPVIASVTSTQEFDLMSDTVSMTTDGKWTETSVYKVTLLADNTTSSLVTQVSGTFAIANQQINFVQTSGTGGLTFAGSVHGNQLTIVFGGSQFFYNRSA